MEIPTGRQTTRWNPTSRTRTPSSTGPAGATGIAWDHKIAHAALGLSRAAASTAASCLRAWLSGLPAAPAADNIPAESMAHLRRRRLPHLPSARSGYRRTDVCVLTTTGVRSLAPYKFAKSNIFLVWRRSPIYKAPDHFLRQLLASPDVWTQDPWEASLFYVPSFMCARFCHPINTHKSRSMCTLSDGRSESAARSPSCALV